MDTAIFVAQIASVLYLSFAVGLLFSGDYYKKMMPKLLDQPGYLLMGGFLNLLIGFLIIKSHNAWNNDWTVLVTLIGWIALVKGVFLIAFPKSFDHFRPMLENGKMMKWAMPLTLILGLVFGYFGFVA